MADPAHDGEMSRRRFLKVVVPAAGGIAVAGVAVVSLSDDSLRDLYQRVSPELSDAPVSALSDDTIEALSAFTGALLGGGIDTTRYQQFFRWRAENVRGHGRLYDRFVRSLDRSAEASLGVRFVECPEERRLEMLGDIVTLDREKWAKVRATLFDRDWLLFNKHIVDQVFKVFARTDAWLLLGYDDFPGVPRGFDAYTSAPRGLR